MAATIDYIVVASIERFRSKLRRKPAVLGRERHRDVSPAHRGLKNLYRPHSW